mmetsp:Transcript_26061/g.42458  ORF Transcript_26061/g.42458 Transcript_26061/m.42458 type:complete len:92 (-) Transcript_26061:162-437(-)
MTMMLMKCIHNALAHTSKTLYLLMLNKNNMTSFTRDTSSRQQKKKKKLHIFSNAKKQACQKFRDATTAGEGGGAKLDDNWLSSSSISADCQ